MSIFQDAKRGDPAAIRSLLEQSLGKNDFSFEVKAKDNNLYIAVYYNNLPQKYSFLKEITLLLKRLKVSTYNQAIVYGYKLTASSPDLKVIIELEVERKLEVEQETDLVTRSSENNQVKIPTDKHVEKKKNIIRSAPSQPYISTQSSAHRFVQRMNRMRQVGQRINIIKNPTLDALKILETSIKKVRPVYFPLMVFSIPTIIFSELEFQSSYSSLLESY
ncbi:MAG: hypothetical protein HC921_20985 [Synechococcaceae cyanobacterium SM2_3_1]|nr:hypothetical protein [Synechococcaceae cyanobacterium SM2_3_1]